MQLLLNFSHVFLKYLLLIYLQLCRLAASLAAEEEDTSVDVASTSVMNDVQDDDEEDEEMVLPMLPGKVDPTVLAALPPSMQLDLLVQMRESLMAENRQKYQKIKKAPKKFSELQIQSYLKTVAFRREIDEVQKAAAGKGLGGVQPSRIASEANREFIFSSSFTGDKQVLTSARLGKDQDGGHHATLKEPISSGTSNSKQPACQFSSLSGFTDGQPTEKFDHSVGTYRDESGRFRVSRLRGLGIRMTRDLEQNLRLMKELEQERMQTISTNNESTAYKETYLQAPNVSSEVEGDGKTIGDKDAEEADISNYYTEPSALGSKSSIEISFEEDDRGMKEADDDDDDDDDDRSFFARLVEGSSTLQLYAGDISTSIIKDKDQDCKSDDDKVGKLFDVEDINSTEDEIEWEEETCHDEIIKDIDQDCKRDDKVGMLSTVEDDNNNEDEVEWEEGACHVPGDASPSQTEYKESVLRRPLEEEADIQEAIRRSLLDFSVKQSSVLSSNKDNLETSNKILREEVVGQLGQGPTFGSKIGSPYHPIKSDIQQNKASSSAVDSITGRDNVNDIDDQQMKQMINSPKGSLTFSAVPEVINDRKSSSLDEPNGRFQVLDPLLQCQETPTDKPVPVEPSHANEVSSQKSMEVSSLEHEVVQKSAPEQVLVINRSKSVSGFEEFQSGELKEPTIGKDDDIVSDTELHSHKNTVQDTMEIPSEALQAEIQFETSHASLGEEILKLRQEQKSLRDENRRLERNAETVSNEMFAECQELLQMFGLPYIIAPMEAEAQCAYMELANLVDGVVTDDSDVFLFGARSVFKNIFDDRKYVETYFMKDIENELGLTREKLIRMALLLGSDYTEGVSGIGIVNAIEVVHAFPEADGLQKFREWLESPDPAILGKLDARSANGSKRRRSKESSTDADASDNNVNGSTCSESVLLHDDEPSENDISDTKQIFMDNHRNVSKNWHIPSTFPSESVISAYISPQVDESTEPFSWGKPDLHILRKLCWERFGWNNQKVDELLLPVLREYNKHETQLRLEAFYTFNERFAKIRSQRIKKALKGITSKSSSELIEDQAQEPSSKRKTRKSSAAPEENETERLSVEKEDTVQSAEMENKTSKKMASRKSGKRRMKRLATESDEKNTEQKKQGVIMEGFMNYHQHHVEVTRARKQENNAVDDTRDVCIPSRYDDGNHMTGAAREEESPCEMGGTEVVHSHGSESEIRGPPLEDTLPKDYLFSGGGFCVEEEHDKSNDSTQQHIYDQGPSSEQFLGKDNASKETEASPGSSVVMETDLVAKKAGIESGIGSGLTAMPALRRKRKA
ncbi:DNA repair protein UVH3 [Acorus gramineus]|uniref:DNA repair protein UVH3 n=1 Tax=Acorus gramineus TaxID=55184 RepID=A0AAV9AUU0_ACOGR|nr:DNA repair protein UVH3 [Acorus gramineus]